MQPMWKRSIALMLVLALTFFMLVPVDANAQGTTNRQGGYSVPVTGTLNQAAATGTFTIKRFDRDGDQLVAVGILSLTSAAAQGTEALVLPNVKVPVTAASTHAASAASGVAIQQIGCDILNLVLGPVDLNILGLTIHLDQVVLDIVAVPGAGNLLGNLLCAIAGLLNGGLPIGNLLNQLIALLNQILAILS